MSSCKQAGMREREEDTERKRRKGIDTKLPRASEYF